MSPVCFSRWYRPPEVILQTDDYDEKSDIWSFGCIMSELAHKSGNATEKNAEILFKGDSCYPLSPMH
jgi:serine/threonine protein kinase